jgi:hypothetical protein
MFHQNVRLFPNYTALQHRKPYSVLLGEFRNLVLYLGRIYRVFQEEGLVFWEVIV